MRNWTFRLEPLVRRFAWSAPAFSVTVLFAIAVLVYGMIAPLPGSWAESTGPLTDRDQQFRALGGLLWGTSVVLFLAISAAACAVLAITAYRSLREYVRGWPSPAAVGVAAVAAAAPLLLVVHPRSPLGGERFVTTRIIDHVVPEIGGVVGALWTVTMLAAVLVAVGACASLVETPRAKVIAGPAGEEPASAHAYPLTIQQRRLQTVLFAGAAVLVAGVVELDALYSWVTQMADLGPNAKEKAKLITASATVTTGTFFTLFLAAVYVPAALILRERAAEVAEAALPAGAPQERAAWIERQGLHTSVAAQLSSVVALLGPLLAGGPLTALGHAFG